MKPCRTSVPEEVRARVDLPPRTPVTDPTLGIGVPAAPESPPPAHPLVTVGDSLTHGFQSGAVHNTHLSYPALIARALGTYERFQHPSYERFGGLPCNIEYLVRALEERFGPRINPLELPFAGMALRHLMDEIEDYWERDAQPPSRFGTRNDNLGIFGWDLHDAATRTAAACRADIVTPTDALVKQVVQNANERAALRVLAPGPPGQDQLSPLDTAIALGREDIETLIVFLGANNALKTVTDLRVCWSARDSWADPVAKRGYTVWDPAHFRAELARVADLVGRVGARHTIWATVPHVTIAPIARGVGAKPPGGRYFAAYTRPWVSDRHFDRARHPFISGDEAAAVDTAVDLYNDAITGAVRDARTAGRDWLLLDTCGLLDRLAARRYHEDPAARPDWWTPYVLPAALAELDPVPDSRFLRADPGHGRTAGGLFSLDGVHPTTVAYGLLAQEFIAVMELAGVRFPGPAPARIDFAELLRHDTLVADPPLSLSGDLAWLGWLDDKVGLFRRLLLLGP